MEWKGKKRKVDGLDGEGGAAHTYLFFSFSFLLCWITKFHRFQAEARPVKEEVETL